MPFDYIVRKYDIWHKYLLPEGSHKLKIEWKNPDPDFRINFKDVVIYSSNKSSSTKRHIGHKYEHAAVTYETFIQNTGLFQACLFYFDFLCAKRKRKKLCGLLTYIRSLKSIAEFLNRSVTYAVLFTGRILHRTRFFPCCFISFTVLETILPPGN